MISIHLGLLEVELIDFSIEKGSYPKEDELKSLNDHRPVISVGHSENQNFVEFTINTQVFKNGNICSITTFSRFVVSFEGNEFNLIKNRGSKDGIDILAEMGVMASSHLMGAFRIKTNKTDFADHVIPPRSKGEFINMFADSFK